MECAHDSYELLYDSCALLQLESEEEGEEVLQYWSEGGIGPIPGRCSEALIK